MSALESQVIITLRGTAGDEARDPLRFLQRIAFWRFFLQTLLRFTFAPAEWAAPSAPSATGEAVSRHAHAKAASTAIGNATPLPPPNRTIDGTVEAATPSHISTCPQGDGDFYRYRRLG